MNVVLIAHRGDHPDHGWLRGWFDDLVAGTEPFSVPTVVWGSFLRLATNRRLFEVPTPLEEVFDFVEAVCGQPHHLLLGPGPRHLRLLRRLCHEGAAAGELVPDAVIAAVALEHGCRIATLDRDFARFRSVEHFIPARA